MSGLDAATERLLRELVPQVLGAADPRVAEHHRLDAVRAHLLERAGDRDGAFAHYRRAAERTTSLPERDYLLMKAGRLRDRSAWEDP
jgi:predicted RNA polymerase sigma factor